MRGEGISHSNGAKAPDLVVLVSVIIFVLGILSVLLIAGAIQREGVKEVDDWILKSVRELVLKDAPGGRVWAEESVVAITSLGSVVVLAMLSAAVVGLLFMTKRTQAGLLVIIALLGGFGLNRGLKTLFGRERPTVVERLQRVDSKSFPSGHALISTAVYAILGAVGSNLLRDRRMKLYVIFISTLLPILIGLSRVYLGVHYATDVVAGWTVGFLWALLCWLVARQLQRRGS